jgi:hypothetical protein
MYVPAGLSLPERIKAAELGLAVPDSQHQLLTDCSCATRAYCRGCCGLFGLMTGFAFVSCLDTGFAPGLPALFGQFTLMCRLPHQFLSSFARDGVYAF